MHRILLIEDEPDLRDVVQFNLEEAGYEVFTAANGGDGLRIAQEKKPALILLDIMLPDTSGLDVCRTLKNSPKTAHLFVVLLTAKAEEIDRVVGFELGADDYVVKPFSVRELTLRVAAHLRRSGSSAEAEAFVNFGVMRIDREAHRIWVAGAELELTALEFKLLMLLHDRRDRVQSRAVLLDVVWGIQADVSTRTVDTHVKRLREKLGAARNYIETVRGVGYRFIGRPEEAEE